MNDPLFRRGIDHGLKPKALGISTGPLVLIRDLILRETGQIFDDQKLDLLADKITDLVARKGLASLLDYYYVLKYDPEPEQHWHQLLDRLAVPETYFWRQPDQIEALTRDVLPRHERERPGATIRVWCAACCSGEEPLSIAMALDREGWFERMSIEIVGTDASPALVERARSNKFGERSMRAIPAELRDRYFTHDGTSWRIAPALHARVRWGRANLVVPAEVAPLASADVIYCRNVFIYFSEDVIREITASFARSMPRRGILFLGAAESLLRLSTEFRMIDLGPAFAYVPASADEHDRGWKQPARSTEKVQ